jgi:hypothetical protein
MVAERDADPSRLCRVHSQHTFGVHASIMRQGSPPPQSRASGRRLLNTQGKLA